MSASDSKARKFAIETLCTGANDAWSGWKITRRYSDRQVRDDALLTLQSLPQRCWAYRSAGAK